MSILEIRNLSHRYDDRNLFLNANLTVNNGEHLGVVGLNGAGKTTFINIIAGKLSQDDGEVLRQSSARWGYLDQHADITLQIRIYMLAPEGKQQGHRGKGIFERSGDGHPRGLQIYR